MQAPSSCDFTIIKKSLFLIVDVVHKKEQRLIRRVSVPFVKIMNENDYDYQYYV